MDAALRRFEPFMDCSCLRFFFMILNGITYVYPNSGGISVFNTPDYALSKNWWVCHANVILPSAGGRKFPGHKALK
jgi:hypothetical protein